MRRILLGILGLGACLLAAAPARAGVYASFERIDTPDVMTGETMIQNLRGLPALTPKQIEERIRDKDVLARYLEPFPALLAQEQAGTLSTLDRVDLGACYIRRVKWAEAIRVLEAGDQTHFLILANLASAYQGIGRLDRAIDCQQRALKAWPATWVWWNEGQRRGYRRVEAYYLTLLRLRAIEEARNRGQAPPITAVDDLFPGVRFVGPSGEYEAGNLADSMMSRLPPDCIPIVYQLLIGNPGDARLHWLWGELLNGYAGRVDLASEIFKDLVDKQGLSGVRELQQHRRILLSVVKMQKNIKPQEWSALLGTLHTVADVQPVACGISPALHQVGAVAIPLALREDKIAPQTKDPSSDVSLPPPPKVRPSFNWRHIAVGFIAGAAFSALAALQLREWRRRQAANSVVLLGEEDRAPVGAANEAPSEQIQTDSGRSGMSGPR